jgi:NAD(P)-dependent dehydrogenase (short-subunit alcohol dehydrogenase family)
VTPISDAQVGGVLAGRLCVVTGAAAGIGRAIARLFARAGAELVVADRDAEGLARLVAGLDHDGLPIAGAVTTDVTHADAPAQILAPALARGGVDVLVNNAGITTVRPLLETTDADWDRAVGTCLTSAFRLSREAVRSMAAHGRGGSIVNLASVNAMVGQPCVSAYAAAKGGIHAMTRQMAVECGRFGIRVNALSPGLIVTETLATQLTQEDVRLTIEAYPLGRLGRPDDVAHAALFLASDAASFLTGVDLPVDGGLTALAAAAAVSPRIRARAGRPPLVLADSQTA